MAKARGLYFTSPTLDATAAVSLGLVNTVFEPDALEAAVMNVANSLADGPRTAIAYIKDNLNDSSHLPLGEMLDRECWRQVRCMETPDHYEAARAFVEKRPPRFG